MVLEKLVSKLTRINDVPSWRTKRVIFSLLRSFHVLCDDFGKFVKDSEEVFKGVIEDLINPREENNNIKNKSVFNEHISYNHFRATHFPEKGHKLIYERYEDIYFGAQKNTFDLLINFKDNKKELARVLFFNRALIKLPLLNQMLGFKDHYDVINQLIKEKKSHFYLDLLSNNFEKVIIENKEAIGSLKDIYYSIDTLMGPLKKYDNPLIKILPQLTETKTIRLNQILDESVHKYKLVLSNLNEIDDLKLNANSRIPLVLKKHVGGGADRDVHTGINHSGENCIVKIIDVSRLREEDKKLFQYYFDKGIVPEKEHAEELSQHNIVPVYGFGPCFYKGKPTWYIVEKLISNQAVQNGIRKISSQPSKNLEQLLNPFDKGFTFGIFSNIFFGNSGHGLVYALDYLHRQEKTFGDIKPDNVAVQQITNLDEKTILLRPYFCDLENIRNLTLDSNVSGLTNHSHIYQPPERFDSNGEFILGVSSTEADMFAMGVTMYISLTGVHPFLPKYNNLAEIRSERSKSSEQRKEMNQEYLNNLHDRKNVSIISERLNQRLNDNSFIEFLPEPDYILGIIMGSIMPEIEKRLSSGPHLNEHFKIYSEKYNQATQTEEYQKHLKKKKEFSKENFNGRPLVLI